MKEQICCFLGHQRIKDTPELRAQLLETIERLIANEGFNTFLFGSMSEFYPVCHEIVTQLKEKYPHIKRVYVRSDHPYLSGDEQAHLAQLYEDTYFPPPRPSNIYTDFVERNIHMVSRSQVCIFYFNSRGKSKIRKVTYGEVTLERLKSSAGIVYQYAVKKQKQIINVYPFGLAKTGRKAKPRRRKPGTGSIRQVKDTLWKGTFSPKGANGKRITRSVSAQTKAECEERLACLIVEMKAQIAAEKASLASRETLPL